MRETVILHIQKAIEVAVSDYFRAEAALKIRKKETAEQQREVHYRGTQLVEMADFLDEYSSGTLKEGEDWLNDVLRNDTVISTELRARYDSLMKDDSNWNARLVCGPGSYRFIYGGGNNSAISEEYDDLYDNQDSSPTHQVPRSYNSMEELLTDYRRIREDLQSFGSVEEKQSSDNSEDEVKPSTDSDEDQEATDEEQEVSDSDEEEQEESDSDEEVLLCLSHAEEFDRTISLSYVVRSNGGSQCQLFVHAESSQNKISSVYQEPNFYDYLGKTAAYSLAEGLVAVIPLLGYYYLIGA